MLLEHALRLAFRNFSTLFLIVATVVAPLHLAYALAFRQSAAPGLAAWWASWLIVALEVALVPVLARAARGVIATDLGGGVPTAWEGLRALHAPPLVERPAGSSVTAVSASAALAVAVAVLVFAIGSLFAALVPGSARVAALAAVRTAATASGMPFLLCAVALSRGAAKADPDEKSTSL